MNNYFLSHGPGIRLFNYTATFRRESDYPLTLQWLPSLDYLLTPVAVSLEEKNQLRREGLAPVLYMQSHCDVPSDRDRYVQELMKYIQVQYREPFLKVHAKRVLMPHILHPPIFTYAKILYIYFGNVDLVRWLQITVVKFKIDMQPFSQKCLIQV